MNKVNSPKFQNDLKALNEISLKEYLSENVKAMESRIIEDLLCGLEDIASKKNMRPSDIAKGIGVSPSYISQIFNFRKTPNLNFVAKIAVLLEAEIQVKVIEDECYFSKDLKDLVDSLDKDKSNYIELFQSNEVMMSDLSKFIGGYEDQRIPEPEDKHSKSIEFSTNPQTDYGIAG